MKAEDARRLNAEFQACRPSRIAAEVTRIDEIIARQARKGDTWVDVVSSYEIMEDVIRQLHERGFVVGCRDGCIFKITWG